MPAYALTIFIGAFLLFQVQPLMGKFILPWFGGGPGVWTTCMLFFQVLLLAGYAYAHWVTRYLRPRGQVVLQLALMAASLALLPITPGDNWKPTPGEAPAWHIVALLAANLGLPYLVLSSTGPLLQTWFNYTHPGISAYRLYALSNAGSFLALVSFPFYFEPHFTRHTQATFWGWGLVLYCVCFTFQALEVWRLRTPKESPSHKPQGQSAVTAPATPLHKALWVLLPFCASVLLLATTNKLCLDMAVIPFLWVLPLAVYLLSFVICFDNPRWYVRFPFTLALIAALGGVCWAVFRGDTWPIWQLVTAYSVFLFVCCMVCHGELYRLRPEARDLTAFYLAIAAGGAMGGIFVAVIAPAIFTGYYELQCGILLCAVLLLLACVANRQNADAREWRWLAWTLPVAILVGFERLLAGVSAAEPDLRTVLTGVRVGIGAFAVLLVVMLYVLRGRLRTPNRWRILSCVWLGLGVVALGGALWFIRARTVEPIVEKSRNFYGVLTVFESGRDNPTNHLFGLVHGRISHGWQFTAPERAAWPTLYFGEQSGVGRAMHALPAGGRRIGVVGLGIGVLTCYTRQGDYVRIYEINPEVERLAKSRFGYLANSGGKVDVVLGDARLSLEREEPQGFDMLVLDAFSGDAVPTHLLTREAFETYERHLNTNAVIAIHISNHYLDLEPVLANLARQFNYSTAAIYSNGNPDQWWIKPSAWILLTRDAKILEAPGIHENARPARMRDPEVALWTDDFTSIYPILR